MGAIVAIARVGFGEAVRRRIVWTLLAVAGLVCAGSLVLSGLAVGDGTKVVKDLGLSAMSLLGLIMAVWLGSEAFGRDLEASPSEPLLSRPVSRERYILGRYLALALVLFLSAAAMGAVFAGLLWAQGAALRLELLWAALLIYVELLLVVAAGFLFATVLRPSLALYATIGLVIAGRSAAEAGQLLAQGGTAQHVLAWLCGLLPDLARLDVKGAAVSGIALPPLQLVADALYGLGWAGVLLMLAMVALRRRDLT